MASSSALVLFSGGQDSTVCLAWALERYEHVETVGFTYGQRHIVEIEQRAVILSKLAEFDEVGQRLGPDTVLELAALKSVSDTALTRETEITFAATGLPTTFVPARNLLFLTYAAALAYRRGIDTLVGGMCETDFSGYPDCRNDTVQALAKALSLGLDRPMTIETPLMFLDKAGTWELASSLGGETRRPHHRGHAHLLPRRPFASPSLGLWLWPVPGVRTESEGMDSMASSDDLKRAVELALAGDWDGAHAIAQGDESDPLFCWLHACLHKIQGDTGNSRYWYAKAGTRFDDFADATAELQAIRATIS